MRLTAVMIMIFYASASHAQFDDFFKNTFKDSCNYYLGIHEIIPCSAFSANLTDLRMDYEIRLPPDLNLSNISKFYIIVSSVDTAIRYKSCGGANGLLWTDTIVDYCVLENKLFTLIKVHFIYDEKTFENRKRLGSFCIRTTVSSSFSHGASFYLYSPN